MSILHQRPRSPAAAPPLEDENLLPEILLRLPPLPSSLPRASAVCKRWRHLVSGPSFARRFRRHHRRNPPLLGFLDIYDHLSFIPALEAPNRVPPGLLFPLPPGLRDYCQPLGCRHGLVLVYFRKIHQVLVWDPATGYQHRFAVHPGFCLYSRISGAVLRVAGDADHFQVVLVGNSDKQDTLAVASVYSSETGAWSNLVSTPLPPKSVVDYPTFPGVCTVMVAVLVGDSLHWRLSDCSPSILEFDLGRQSLAVIPTPVDPKSVVRADGGGLGLLFLSNSSAQLWKRNTDCHGVTSWVLGRSIELDKLLSLAPEDGVLLAGYAEENNVALVLTSEGLFMISLESSQCKKLLETDRWSYHHAFESVYTPETGIGGGHDGADLLRNT